ncbi:WXG100 family type VII secretion target [Paenibacillus polymyxa]|uniref:WXG100 family type VII secretion target n=1 Tax=Paenibacillus polymyxa TaxID=1406 RepID=A0A8I1IKZ7_PAEPO|nr:MULTISPECIES: WXG100 family type VII secretion target [Paenibacillus]KAF6576885.1 WXG100 family type VII secretion target [Paenibacillus sp. EKM206P]KAF6590928.1 WXG100 family type VII secretion target [Paenibacillus sp. EKM205P]MBM0631652.1 WXG100 family type VII secretion target [Paenibacillus polymyxa]
MGRILVSPDKLMEVADQFLHGKHEMERMLNLLNGRIDFVQQGWSGATQERFFQEFQVSRQSMSVTLERLSMVAQELIFISKSFTQVDGEKVVLDVPWLDTPVKTASTGEGWLHKIFEQIGQAEITKSEAQLEASKLQREILWDTAQGAKGAIQGNLTLGIWPDKERNYDHPMAAKVGEILGNVATTLQGAGEVVAGLGGEGLSVAISSTGVGSIIGVPGLIGSAALAAHGATTAVKSAKGVGESSAELWQMGKGEGGGSAKSTSSSGAKPESTPHALKGGDEGGNYAKPYDGTRNPEVDFMNSKGKSTLDKHANKHDYDSPESYLHDAREFLEKRPTSTTQTFVSNEGTYFRYDSATNEFGIINKYGGISTYFKPEDGLEYWLEQISLYSPK